MFYYRANIQQSARIPPSSMTSVNHSVTFLLFFALACLVHPYCCMSVVYR